MKLFCQQDEVYAAQAEVSRGQSFRTIEEMQAWVDSLRDTHEWNAMGWWIVSRIEVTDQDKGARSTGGFEKEKNAGVVAMAPWDWDQRGLLHEMAHVLARATHESQAHDPCFARTFLILVSSFMGQSVYTELQAAFDRHGVDYEFPVVPESRFAL